MGLDCTGIQLFWCPDGVGRPCNPQEGPETLQFVSLEATRVAIGLSDFTEYRTFQGVKFNLRVSGA